MEEVGFPLLSVRGDGGRACADSRQRCENKSRRQQPRRIDLKGERQVIVAPLPRFGGEASGVRGTNNPRPDPSPPTPLPEYRGEGRTVAAARQITSLGYFSLPVPTCPRPPGQPRAGRSARGRG